MKALDSAAILNPNSYVESPAVVHSPCLIDLAPMFKNIEQNLTMHPATTNVSQGRVDSI
jgi:hypothetical protein